LQTKLMRKLQTFVMNFQGENLHEFPSKSFISNSYS
jgi:hypothetical protein